MYKKEIDKYLDGELPSEETRKLDENSIEKDFIESYQQVIRKNKIEVPDFDPFLKIEPAKEKRISLAKRLFPYAASFLLIISLFFLFQNSKTNKTELVTNEQELNEIQKNTEMALLHFSKELNACMKKFEDAKYLQQPVHEIEQLKEIKIDKSNPFKNIKIK